MGSSITSPESQYLTQQRAAALAGGRGYSATDALGDLGRYRTDLTLRAPVPSPPPDLTDAAVRYAQLQGLGAIGQGRKSTFLSGPTGAAAPTTQRKTLLGG